MKKEILSIGVVALGIMIAVGVLMVSGNGALAAKGFGFEKNIKHRGSADAESVLGCMASCEEMAAGWLEMNPDSKNYTRQQAKIEAKAEQCLAMNTLAGSPVAEEDILTSCGLGSRCVEIPPDISIDFGACGDVSLIAEMNLPQCCTEETPRGIDCGADAEWVVGVAAFPVCFIPNS